MTPPRTPELSVSIDALLNELQRLEPDAGWTLRTAVRLHPRSGNPSLARSKMGGAIRWSPGTPWPHCEAHDDDYVPVLQLTRRDVPELGWPEDADLFQLLWCPNDHSDSGYGPRVAAYFWNAEDLRMHPMPQPRGTANQDYIPSACQLFPERGPELPNPDEFKRTPGPGPIGGATTVALDAWLRQYAKEDIQRLGIPVDDPLYQYHFSAAPGCKVGGYPQWIQGPIAPRCEAGHPMEYLLTLASCEFDGSFQRWMPLADRTGADHGLSDRLC